MGDTFLVRLPLFLYNKSFGRFLNKQTPEHIEWEAEGAEDDNSDPLSTALPPNANGESRKRKAKAKQ